MILSFITEFTEYLARNGYSVTEPEHIHLLRLLQIADLDIGRRDQMLSAMQTAFAKNEAERIQLKRLFQEFLDARENIREMENLEKQKEESENRMQTAVLSLESLISQLQNQKQDAVRKAQEEKETELRNADTEKKPLLGKKQKKQKELLSGMKFPDEKKKKLLLDEVLNDQGTPALTQAQWKAVMELLDKLVEQALRGNQMTEAAALLDIQKKLKPKAGQEDPIRKAILEAGRKAGAEFDRKISELNGKLAEERRIHQQKQWEIGDMLRRLRAATNKLTIKEASANHRQEFQGGGSVQTYGSDISAAQANKNFKSLSQAEKRAIYDYIRKNVLAFKTRMTRNIRAYERRHISMEGTIEQAIRTGGVPMKLVYDLPKRGKSDLVMILDVSGSCKSASEMMLTFIGLLKEVFPRGCKAFAFVNSLYDISEVYEASDLDHAVTEALNMIPRSGQYSNYEKPLREMWTEHCHDITKDSIVVFIGDARNNKFDSGELYMKNICRKAKAAYWLNTETMDQWDYQDSLASLYGKYARMFEVVNVGQLIQFINAIR